MINVIRKLSILSLLVLVFGCKKENDRVFEEEPSERQAKVIDKLYTMLTTSENGWKVTIYPKGGKGFRHWMKLKSNDRVEMVSDFNVTSATVPKESTFRISALQTPTLIFDTYNYIHLPYDPTASISGGTTNGTGLLSDIEFFPGAGLVDSLLKDLPVSKTTLIGKYNGNYTIFEKATAAEEAAYKAGGLDKTRNNIATFISTTPKFLYVELEGTQKIQFNYAATTKTISLSYEKDNGVVTEGPATFAHTLNSLKLSKALKYNNISFDEIFYDEATKVLYILNGSNRIVVKGTSAPILPLHYFLGSTGYMNIVAPDATTYAGWSPDFMARRAQAVTSLKNGGYNLTLKAITFGFNRTLKTLTITANIPQNTTNYNALFYLNFEKDANGIYKFSKADPYLGTNGSITETGLAPIIGNRILTDKFVIEYYSDPVLGNLGMFKSVENPDFYFTGTIN